MTIVEPSTKAHFHVVPPPSIAQKIGVFIFEEEEEEEEEEEDDSIFFDSLMRKRRRRDTLGDNVNRFFGYRKA